MPDKIKSETANFLGIIHRHDLIKNDVSETGICLRHQVKPTLLGSVDRVSTCLRTTVVVEVKAYWCYLHPEYGSDMFL
jgi:hypothetical protein